MSPHTFVGATVTTRIPGDDPGVLYEVAAEFVAAHPRDYPGLREVRSLYLPTAVMEAIDADPDAFARRVADYAYAAAQADATRLGLPSTLIQK